MRSLILSQSRDLRMDVICTIHYALKYIGFRSFNHSAWKTVLNLLEAIYVRLRKIVVERITVMKFKLTVTIGLSLAIFAVL